MCTPCPQFFDHPLTISQYAQYFGLAMVWFSFHKGICKESLWPILQKAQAAGLAMTWSCPTKKRGHGVHMFSVANRDLLDIANSSEVPLINPWDTQGTPEFRYNSPRGRSKEYWIQKEEKSQYESLYVIGEVSNMPLLNLMYRQIGANADLWNIPEKNMMEIVKMFLEMEIK
jgi:hypothetical protein